MDLSTQYSFAPLLLMLVAEVDEELERARTESAGSSADRHGGASIYAAAAVPPSRPSITPSALQAERDRLVHALHRIENGTYGRCSRCARDISAERLTIQPHALTCMPCLLALGSQ